MQKYQTIRKQQITRSIRRRYQPLRNSPIANAKCKLSGRRHSLSPADSWRPSRLSLYWPKRSGFQGRMASCFTQPCMVTHVRWKTTQTLSFKAINPNPNENGWCMKTNSKILIYLILFAIIDTIIPVPITAIMLIYVLYEKPDWFKNLVTRIYDANWVKTNWKLCVIGNWWVV